MVGVDGNVAMTCLHDWRGSCFATIFVPTED